MQVAVRKFTDPGEFAAALCPSKVELIPTGHGRFTGEFVSLDLPRARLYRLIETLARLAHVQHPPDRAYIGFLADETTAPLVVDGMTIDVDAVLQFGTALSSNQHSSGPARWANLSLPRAELDAMSRATAGQDLAPGSAARVLVPKKTAMRRLRTLHAGAIALARHSPSVLAEPEAVRGIEEPLMEAMVDCLTCSEQRRPSPVQIRHAAVMGRFRELLDANLDRPLYLPEVCAAVGVSHRTLSYCCQDFLGMSPKRYFYLRRMYMVRRVLRVSDRHTTTVTEVATRHGFWEFGRFAVQYKALFGETPSATLRRESGECDPPNLI